MKATVLAESSENVSTFSDLSAPAMSTDMSQVGVALFHPWTYGRYVFLPYVRLINCHFHLFRSSAPSFSFQYLLVSQIIKELCSSYSFHFHHLPFNGIMKEGISSQNMTNPIGFSTDDII